MFLRTILWQPEGLPPLRLERAIPWADLAAFLTRAPHVPSNHLQNDKLDKNNVLLEDWAMRGMAWVWRVFERRSREGNEGRLMDMDACDAMWEDDDDNGKGSRRPWRPSRRGAPYRLAAMFPSSSSASDGMERKRGGLTECSGEVRVWEEEERQAGEEEHKKLGRRRVDLDGDELMDVEDDPDNDSEEIKALNISVSVKL